MKMCHCKWRNRKESLNAASEGKTEYGCVFPICFPHSLLVWGLGNEHGKVSWSPVCSKCRVTAWAGQGECAVPDILVCDREPREKAGPWPAVGTGLC